MNPIEMHNRTFNTPNVMNACAGASNKYAFYDQRDQEYMEWASIKNCSTEYEMNELKSMYNEYIEALEKYNGYKNYLLSRAIRTGFTSVQGTMYTI